MRRTCCLLLLLLLHAPVASADEATEAEPAPATETETLLGPAPELDVRLRVYGWAADWDGEVGAGDATFDADASLGVAFPENNFGAGGELDVRWRRFVMVVGGRWSDLDDHQHVDPVSGTVGPAFLGRIDGEPDFWPPWLLALAIPEHDYRGAGGRIDVDVEEIDADLLLGYRVLASPLPTWLGGAEEDEPRFFDLDLLAGVRYHRVETSIDVQIPPVEFDPYVAEGLGIDDGFLFRVSLPSEFLRVGLVPPGVGLARVLGTSFRYEAEEQWVDPVLGLRLGIDLCERLRLRVQGDIGGFGIGSASDLSWTAEAGLTVRITRHWEAELAWLAAGLDRDRGQGSIDTIQHGPKAGITYRF